MKTLIEQNTATNLPVDAISFTDHIDARVLAASTAETVTVPTGATAVFFSSTADFYVNAFITATVPAADVTDGTASELNPLQRSVQGIASFSMIAPAAATITMAFYK